MMTTLVAAQLIRKDEKAELAYAGLPVSLSKAQRLFSNLLICGLLGTMKKG